MTTPDPGPQPRLIEVEEFFADPAFIVPTISPDGTRIAYLAPHRGRRNVWVCGVDQTHDDAVPVTHDTRRGITTYHWTDDPRWLLYQQDTDGNEDWHLHRVDLDDPAAPALDLTPMGPGSRVFGVEPLPSVPGNVLVWMNLGSATSTSTASTSPPARSCCTTRRPIRWSRRCSTGRGSRRSRS